MQLFDQLEDVQEKNGVIKGRIMRRIKGGYTVDLGGVEAFLPGSMWTCAPCRTWTLW